jgi:hypothetical protein
MSRSSAQEKRSLSMTNEPEVATFDSGIEVVTSNLQKIQFTSSH